MIGQQYAGYKGRAKRGARVVSLMVDYGRFIVDLWFMLQLGQIGAGYTLGYVELARLTNFSESRTIWSAI